MNGCCIMADAAVAYIGPGSGPAVPAVLQIGAVCCMVAFTLFVMLRKDHGK